MEKVSVPVASPQVISPVQGQSSRSVNSPERPVSVAPSSIVWSAGVEVMVGSVLAKVNGAAATIKKAVTSRKSESDLKIFVGLVRKGTFHLFFGFLHIAA